MFIWMVSATFRVNCCVARSWARVHRAAGKTCPEHVETRGIHGSAVQESARCHQGGGTEPTGHTGAPRDCAVDSGVRLLCQVEDRYPNRNLRVAFRGVVGFGVAMFRSSDSNLQTASSIGAPKGGLSKEARTLLTAAASDPGGYVLYEKFGASVDMHANGVSLLTDKLDHRAVPLGVGLTGTRRQWPPRRAGRTWRGL